jgi:hypothetical protein
MEDLSTLLVSILTQGVVKYPFLATTVAVVGVLRLINKPLFSFLRVVTAATKTPSDDAFLDKVETSKVYKTVSYVLDWFGSIKSPTEAAKK